MISDIELDSINSDKMLRIYMQACTRVFER